MSWRVEHKKYIRHMEKLEHKQKLEQERIQKENATQIKKENNARDKRIIEFIKKNLNLESDLVRIKNLSCGSPCGHFFFTNGEDVYSFICICKRCRGDNGCKKCPYIKGTREQQKDGYPIYLEKLDELPLFGEHVPEPDKISKERYAKWLARYVCFD